MQATEVECPNCGAPVTELDPDEHVRCQYCGTALNLARSLCPNCQFAKLVREPGNIVRCPVCGWGNGAGCT